MATRIQEIEPRVVFTHCYGHALNLSVADTIKQLVTMKDCLDTCTEVIKLIKFSPKCEAMLQAYKDEVGVKLLEYALFVQQDGLSVQKVLPVF